MVSKHTYTSQADTPIGKHIHRETHIHTSTETHKPLKHTLTQTLYEKKFLKFLCWYHCSQNYCHSETKEGDLGVGESDRETRVEKVL